MERLEDCPPPFWLSWWHSHEYMGAFELHSPWWVSGYGDDGRVSICAAICARNAIDASKKVWCSYDKEPPTLNFRFCEERPPGWSPFSERFPRADWMEWEG